MSASQNKILFRVKCISKPKGDSVISGRKYKDLPKVNEIYNVINFEKYNDKTYYLLDRKTDEGFLLYWNAVNFEKIEK